MNSLVPSLMYSPVLSAIFLSDNNVGKSGMTRLAAALPQICSLSVLELGGNCIEDEGCRSLAAGMFSALRCSV